MKSFSVVGAGRLGTALAAALVERGWRLGAIVDRDAKAARSCRRIAGQGRATTDMRRIAGAGDVVIVAVPDGEVARVAVKLARAGAPWTGRTVFHTSGLLPARALAPVGEAGGHVASLHPARSVARGRATRRSFRGIVWGFQGDPEALEAARAVVKDLAGDILLLSEGEKPLYHAACSLASNALVALMAAASGLFRAAGIGENEAAGLLFPLAQGTLQNVKKLGPEAALTGPVARGDLATVRKHLEALGGEREALAIYKALGRQALLLVPRGALPPGRVKSMRRLLGGG